MPVLTLHPRYDSESQLLWEAAIKRGWAAQRVGYEPGPHDVHGAGVVVYGGFEWADRVGLLLNTTEMQRPADDWLVTAPLSLTGRITSMLTVSHLKASPRQLRFPVFVKSLNGKFIASRVYHSPDDFPPLSPKELVLVQVPVRWLSEFRAFVLNGRVCALSQYAVEGQLHVAPLWSPVHPECREAQAYVAQVLRGSVLDSLPQAFVLDVGLLAHEGRAPEWAVVEVNPAWCSSIYACDPDAALDVVAASCGVHGNTK
jgi:hypothetical protein